MDAGLSSLTGNSSSSFRSPGPGCIPRQGAVLAPFREKYARRGLMRRSRNPFRTVRSPSSRLHTFLVLVPYALWTINSGQRISWFAGQTSSHWLGATTSRRRCFAPSATRTEITSFAGWLFGRPKT